MPASGCSSAGGGLRVAIVGLERDLTAEAARQVADSSWSRFPVSGRDQDDVVGFVSEKAVPSSNLPATCANEKLAVPSAVPARATFWTPTQSALIGSNTNPTAMYCANALYFPSRCAGRTMPRRPAIDR